MKIQWLYKVCLFAAVTLALSGCASQLPESIRGDGRTLTTYDQVQAASAEMIGEQVRWGGVIAEVRNREDASEIEIVGFRTRSFGRPEVNDNSYGRFRVIVSGFIDPEVHAKGRMITVLGTYTGMESGMIGEYNLDFPVIRASGTELWREPQPSANDWRYDVYSPRYRWYMYGAGPYRVYPYYYPYTPMMQPAPRRRATQRTHEQPTQQQPTQQQRNDRESRPPIEPIRPRRVQIE